MSLMLPYAKLPTRSGEEPQGSIGRPQGLLNGHPDLPQGLLERLLERPALTATQCRDYFEAYAADPGRFVDPPPTSPSPTGHSDQLSGYAAVLPSAQEVPHDLH